MAESYLKITVLKLLQKEPYSGYDLIKTIKQNTQGSWTPSYGSIYPLLNELYKNGFVDLKQVQRKKIYSLTKKGNYAIKSMQKQRKEMINHFEKNLEVFTMLHGSIATNNIHKLIRDLKDDKLPFAEIQPEAENFKDALFQLYFDGKFKLDRSRIKRILRDAKAELEKI